MKRMIKDLSGHFKDKLHTLIVDTIDTCDYADLDGREAACIILDGLLLEVVVGSAVIQLSEQQFMEMCLLAHKTGVRAFTEGERKRKHPAQGD